MWSGKNRHADRRESRRSGRAAYAGRSTLPATAQLVIDRPPVMLHLSNEELRALIRERLDRRVEEVAAERRRRFIKVLGFRKAQSMHFNALPRREEMFARNPKFAAETVAERIALAKAYLAFVEAYRKALAVFRNEDRCVEFPAGTWLMRVRYNAICQSPPPS